MDVKAYLVEKLKQAPRLIAITLGISAVLFVAYFVVITLVNATHMM